MASAADDASPLQVTVNGQVVDDVVANLEKLPRNENFVPHTVCYPTGPRTEVFYGWWLSQLIQAANANPARTSSVTVQRNDRDHGSFTLLPADYDTSTTGSTDFVGGAQAVVSQRSENGVPTFTFFRPVRSEPCPADVNSLDWVQSGTLDIAITTVPLQVTASADPTSATVGQAVHFTSSVEDAPANEHLTTTWTFSDDTTAVGADVTHAFAGTGTYTAVATVSGDLLSGGSSDPVQVTVGTSTEPPGSGHGDPTKPPSGGGTAGPTTGSHVPITTPSGSPTTNAPTSAPTTTPWRTTTAGTRGGAVSTPAPTTPPTVAPTPVAVGASSTPTPSSPPATTAPGDIHGVLVGDLTASGLSDVAVQPLQAVGPHGTATPPLTLGEKGAAGLAALGCLVVGVLSEVVPTMLRRRRQR